MSAIIWDEEYRQFSVVEDQRNYSIDPLTGEVITPKQLKARLEGRTGKKLSQMKDVREIKGKDGKVRKVTGFNSETKGTIGGMRNVAYQKNKKAITDKMKYKEALNNPMAHGKIKAMGKENAALKNSLSRIQSTNRNLKVGAGIAGAAALGAGVYALKKRRDAKKREEQA